MACKASRWLLAPIMPESIDMEWGENGKISGGYAEDNRRIGRRKSTYFARMKSCTGVPLKSHHSRNLFSKKRR